MIQKYKKLRLYRNLVAASVAALKKIFSERKLADQVVASLLRSNKKWGSKDRKFLASTVYDTVRWYRLFYEIKGAPPVTEADWWHILGIKWILEDQELPNWEQFEGLDTATVKQRQQQLIGSRKIHASIPDWLDERGFKELGAAWEPFLKASNEQAALVLRANTLKTSRRDLMDVLNSKGIETQELNQDAALLVPTRRKLTNMPSYERGYFEIQDASSQQVAPFLGVKPGMYVVDACAGAGGKSLHIAAMMQNKGRILSLDVAANKLEQLKIRSKRAAVTILKTQLIRSHKSIEQLYGLADRLLLDVPCSGLGTLRRSPQIKWRFNAKLLTKTLHLQQKILREYAPICKKGGQMVYATCSVLPSENQEQVAAFLSSDFGASFKLIKEQVILPQDQGYDGFYMALLERKEDNLGAW